MGRFRVPKVLGPVFRLESLRAARRWQLYAGRAVLVAALLFALLLIWLPQAAGRTLGFRELASVGQTFYLTLTFVELSLVLAVTPALVSATLNRSRARADLGVLLTTDLTAVEIIFGTLGARLGAVWGVLACGVPMILLASSLGGIDPTLVALHACTIASTAAVGLAVALVLSSYATRPHEAVVASYALWLVWMLAPMAISRFFGGLVPEVINLLYLQPFFLLGNPPIGWVDPFWHLPAYSAGCLTLALLLGGFGAWRLRSAARGGPARRRRRLRWPERWTSRRDARWLDSDPALWLELRRHDSSRWERLVWYAYVGFGIPVALLALMLNDHYALWVGSGFLAAVGLGMIAVTASGSLAEERSRGALDVLMASPLPTRTLVTAKWLTAFRSAPAVAFLIGLMTFGMGLREDYYGGWPSLVLLLDRPELFVPSLVRVLFSLLAAVLLAAVILAQGSVATGLGLIVSIHQRRPARAVPLTVALYLVPTVIWLAVLIALGYFERDDHQPWLLWLSPFGASFLGSDLSWYGRAETFRPFYIVAAYAGLLMVPAVILWAWSVRAFDRRLRTTGSPRTRP